MTRIDSSKTNPWVFTEALGDGVYGVDPSGNCMFVNPAAVHMLGYSSSADLIGQNMHELIHHTRSDGTPYPQSACPLLASSAMGEVVRLESEVLWRKDGSPFLAEYSSYPIREGDSIGGSVVIFTDAFLRQRCPEDARRAIYSQSDPSE